MSLTLVFKHRETAAERTERRLDLAAPTNDIRREIYVPRPDRHVRRAVDRLLNEPDQHRRGAVAAWMVYALVAILLMAGVKW